MVEIKAPVTTITINHPEVRNAVDGPTAEMLAKAFRKFEADENAGVAVLTGAGGYFCAGADLKGLTEGRRLRLSPEGDRPLGPSRMLFSKPVIAVRYTMESL